jgi:hypothetical protein
MKSLKKQANLIPIILYIIFNVFGEYQFIGG